MKDKTGKQEIKLGSYVVYATALGRSARLKFGKIINIDSYEDGDRYHVIGVDDNSNYHPAKLTKRGMLLYESRIVVIPFGMLSNDAQKLLKDV